MTQKLPGYCAATASRVYRRNNRSSLVGLETSLDAMARALSYLGPDDQEIVSNLMRGALAADQASAEGDPIGDLVRAFDFTSEKARREQITPERVARTLSAPQDPFAAAFQNRLANAVLEEASRPNSGSGGRPGPRGGRGLAPWARTRVAIEPLLTLAGKTVENNSTAMRRRPQDTLIGSYAILKNDGHNICNSVARNVW